MRLQHLNLKAISPTPQKNILPCHQQLLKFVNAAANSV
jgi:hypothetical protein